MKDINESGYSSCKATTPELVENHLSREKDDKEILAEALSEIDSPSPISIKEGQSQRILRPHCFYSKIIGIFFFFLIQ